MEEEAATNGEEKTLASPDSAPERAGERGERRERRDAPTVRGPR
jgi:hypothetical protein